MKTNWLWDSRLNERKVKKILGDGKHPKFDIYAEKLLSRINDPKMVFEFIDKITFCRKWPNVKKRIKKDRWVKDKIIFWQVIYERLMAQFKSQGIKIRYPAKNRVPLERAEVAQQIKMMRTRLGYSQKAIAFKLGVIQQYVSKIESGRENFSIDTLTRIANVFDKKLVVKLK